MSCGYGHHDYGYNPCCKPKCGYRCCTPTYSTSPPQVGGTWNLHYSTLTQDGTAAANCGQVTPTATTTLLLTQCPKPNDVFVTASVTAGAGGPFQGDNYVGVFHKDSRGCWTLQMPSSTDNTTFSFNFKHGHCPKKLNFSSTKPFDSDTMMSEVVGGCGEKAHAH